MTNTRYLEDQTESELIQSTLEVGNVSWSLKQGTQFLIKPTVSENVVHPQIGTIGMNYSYIKSH